MFYANFVRDNWTMEFDYSEFNKNEPREYFARGIVKARVTFFPLDDMRAAYCLNLIDGQSLHHFNHCGHIQPLHMGEQVLARAHFQANPAPEDAVFFMGSRTIIREQPPSDFFGYFYLESNPARSGAPARSTLKMVCEYVRPGFSVGGGDPKLGSVPSSPPPES